MLPTVVSTRALVAVLAATFLAAASPARAQAPDSARRAMPAPRPADVASADAIIAALYDVISGPAGQKRDWDRFRSLLLPEARLIVVGRRDTTTGVSRPRVLTAEQYIAGAGPQLERNGFFEREIAQTSESFGGVTHRFSTYDSKHTAADATPFARGINSIQLLNDGRRWWVVTIFWDSERPDNPIPAKYLPK
jgi:hypothetical protein